MYKIKSKKFIPSISIYHIIILFFSYFIFLLSQSIAAFIFLAPWDDVSEAFKPLVGSWQRSVNDFAINGGISILGILTILISVYFFISNNKQKLDKNQEAKDLAMLNLFYAFLNFFFIFIAFWIIKLLGTTPESGIPQILGLFTYVFLIAGYLFCVKKYDRIYF